MATKLSTFEFSNKASGAKRDWSQWADGSIWQLKQGEDFECGVITIASQARLHAKKNELGIKISASKKEGTVTLQFIKGGAAGVATTESKATTEKATTKKGSKAKKGATSDVQA